MNALVDSNIFLDYYLDRKDCMLPLGEFAFRFFKQAIECKYLVLICKAHIYELGKTLGKTEKELWKTVFSSLKEANKIKSIDASRKQMFEARELSGSRKIPFNDCLFAILARDNKALLISRDIHFSKLSDFVDVRKPEELL